VVVALAGLVLMAAVVQAQPAQSPETQAAVRALEITNRNLNRWFVIVIVAVIVAVAVAAWRIWVYGARLSEVDGLRSAWDKRFSDLSDELLRTKRKVTECDGALSQLRAGIATARPGAEAGPTEADVARLQNDLVVIRERLDETDAKVDGFVRRLDAVDTHEQDASAALEAVSKTRAAVESAVAQAERALTRIQALAHLQAGDDGFAIRDYAAAADSYSRWLDGVKGQADEDERLLFRVLHNRAVADLRLERPDRVLADAARIEALTGLGARAGGAAHMLRAAARLEQGLAGEALAEFARAIEVDAYAKVTIARDEDVAAWLVANPKQARGVTRELNKLIAPEKIATVVRKSPVETVVSRGRTSRGGRGKRR